MGGAGGLGEPEPKPRTEQPRSGCGMLGREQDLRMAPEPTEEVRQRWQQLRTQASEREARIADQQFLALPQKLQNQLAVLQSQCEPSDGSYEALVAAEHNLRAYSAKLEQALNLVSQMKGARMRRRSALGRALLKLLLLLLVLGALAAGGWVVVQRVLLPRKAELCQASPDCRAEGRCGAGIRVELPRVELVCQATSDEHCRAAQRCAAQGECMAVEGRCVASATTDCKKTEGCKLDGLCTAQNGRCIAAFREDCGGTAACRERGECTPDQGICRALSDEDCQHCLACKKQGYCTEVQGKCMKLTEQ
jgi:hypothetical protein